MRGTAVFAVVLLLLMSLGGQPAFSQAFDEKGVRPGDSIGPLRLGMTVDQVGALLGRRPDGESTDGSLRTYRWNLDGGVHSGMSSVPVLSISVGADGTAEAISTTSTAFATPGGSGVGMSLKGFKDEFGAAYRGYKDSTGGRHLRFDTVGVDLTYDIRGAGLTTVRSLTVFKAVAAMPGPAPTILPGVGIGPIRLGMSADEATRAMGRSPQVRRNLLIWVLDEKNPFGENAWLWASLDDRGAVWFIYTDALAYQTAQGNAPGISILELQAEFGASFLSRPLVIPGQTAFMGIWYDSQGVAGLYHPADSNKRILLIAVYKRG